MATYTSRVSAIALVVLFMLSIVEFNTCVCDASCPASSYALDRLPDTFLDSKWLVPARSEHIVRRNLAICAACTGKMQASIVDRQQEKRHEQTVDQ